MATNLGVDSLSPEEIDMLRDAFIYMDRDNDGYINKREMLETVRRCVGSERYEPLEEYLIPLFDVADRDHDDKLSLEDFLLSFANGPGVVPAEVINSCVSSIRVRLTDEEIATLQETFRRIDTNADGFIDKEELAEALKENLKYKFSDLCDNNYRDIVAVIMASADADSDGKLCLSEFIRSFQEDQGVLPAAFIDTGTSLTTQMLTEAEIEVLKEAFAVLDKNHDGFVEFNDMYDALWESLAASECDTNQIRELCDLIMVTADRSKTGVLTLADFVVGFTRNMQLLQLPVAIAQERIREACEKLQQLFESGELERRSVGADDPEGCVNPMELVGVLCSLFAAAFPMLDEETMSSVMGAAVVAADKGGLSGVGLDDFIRAFAASPRATSPATLMPVGSPLSPGPVTVTSEELQVVSRVLQELGRVADSDGCVQEPDVLDAIRNAFTTDPQQTERVVQYVRENIVQQGPSDALAADNFASDAEKTADLTNASSLMKTAEAPPDCPCPVAEDAAPLEVPVPVALPKSPKQEESPAQEAATPVLLATRASPREKTPRSLMAVVRLPDTYMQRGMRARRYLESSYDTTRNAIYDNELRREFEKYVPANQTYIDRAEFKKIYLGLEHYGLTPSDREVEQLFSKYSRGNKITYDQFCVIMLQRVRM